MIDQSEIACRGQIIPIHMSRQAPPHGRYGRGNQVEQVGDLEGPRVGWDDVHDEK
jgi:hypothetical protein